MAIPKFVCYLTLLVTLSMGVCSAARVPQVPKATHMDAVIAEPSPPIPIPSPYEWEVEGGLATSLNTTSLDELRIAVQGLTHAMKAKCDCESPFNGSGYTNTDLTSAIQGLTLVMMDRCDCSTPFVGAEKANGDLTSAIQELTNAIKAKSLVLSGNGDA